MDNQAAISQIAGEASSLKAKHVDVRHLFLCDFSRRGIIAASIVRSDEMLAGSLDEGVGRDEARQHARLFARHLRAFLGGHFLKKGRLGGHLWKRG